MVQRPQRRWSGRAPTGASVTATASARCRWTSGRTATCRSVASTPSFRPAYSTPCRPSLPTVSACHSPSRAVRAFATLRWLAMSGVTGSPRGGALARHGKPARTAHRSSALPWQPLHPTQSPPHHHTHTTLHLSPRRCSRSPTRLGRARPTHSRSHSQTVLRPHSQCHRPHTGRLTLPRRPRRRWPSPQSSSQNGSNERLATPLLFRTCCSCRLRCRCRCRTSCT
mmetsp:Transcript_6212/g.20277  ORF Transcript_6212/g.20277 Transcript_6212/m.20277 type:complete len:225 (+) Transcript_6212:1003-1677(+)